MSLHSRFPRWLLIPTTAIVALLWISALFVLWSTRSAGPVELLASKACLAVTDGRPARARAGQFAGAAGVNLDTGELGQSTQNLSQAFDLLERNGITWVRFTLPWDDLEPTRGQYDWSWSDQVFAVLAQHPSIQPLVVLDRSPAWARASADADNPSAPPHQRSDFGAFSAAVAKRYGSLLQYYQVWHEPNIAPHWGARPADPSDYVGLLREAAVQIRAADADAQIVLAGLAPTTELGGANMSDIAYLDALYELNGRPWFDIAAAEPYGFSDPPVASASQDARSLNFGRAVLLRDVMARHGDLCAPLWATSYGWNALPADWAGATSSWGQVSEEEQTNYAVAALDVSAARWPWLGPLFWAALCPPLDPNDPWSGFALCEVGSSAAPSSEYRPRTAWSAMVQAANRPAVLPPGSHPVSHPALQYSSGWRITPDAADPSQDGDSLEFTFYGSDLALQVQGGPYWGFYEIWVDGQPANALPRDETGAAYLVLHDPLGERRLIQVARNLPVSDHRVRLVANGGWGQWALQGLSVGAGSPALARVTESGNGFRWAGWLLLGLALVATAFLPSQAWPRLVRLRPGGGVASEVTPGKPGLEGRSLSASRVMAWLDRPSIAYGGWVWFATVALLLILALSRWLILDLAALAGTALLFFWRPDMSLPLIAATIPLWPRPKHLLRWEFSLFEILIWVAVAATLARWAVDRSRFTPHVSRLRPGSDQGFPFPVSRFSSLIRGLDWPVLAIAVLGLASALAAERHDVAFREFRTVFLCGALFYWLVTRVPFRAGRSFSPWPAVDGLIGGAAIVSTVALWQLLTGQGRVDVEGVWRVRAFYGSPNNLALVLERVIPVALAVAAFGVGGRDEPADFAWGLRARRPLYGIAVVLMVVACVATFSKGAWLLGLPAGVGLVLVLGAWRAHKWWPLWTFVGVLVVGAAGVGLLIRTRRFADLINFRTGTSFFRLRLWQGAWHMALDHPWFGVGPDNFLYAYRTRYVLPDAWQELNLSHPHNIVLDLWTRLGILGLATGIWAVVAAVRRAWFLFLGSPAIPGPAPQGSAGSSTPVRAESRAVGGWIREDAGLWPLALGLMGALAATVAHGLIDNSFFLVDLMAIFMLSLGLLQRLTGREVEAGS